MESEGFLDFVPDFSAPSIVGAYDELPLWSSIFGLLLLEHLPLACRGAVLDVGCGTGFPLIELAERLGPRCQVHGLDPWREGLARAAEKIAHRRVKNVILHEGSATAMPFADATFDLIVSNLGLNNFTDRVSALRECRRVALAGGVLALTTNLQGHMQEFYAVFEDVLERSGSEGDLSRLREHVAHRATVPGVVTLLESGGFAIRRVIERETCFRFSNGTALLNHHFIKLGFLDAWKQVVGTNLPALFGALREALDRRADAAGELRLTIPMAYVEAVAA